MRPLSALLCAAVACAASAQPLVAPPAPLTTPGAPAGAALASPWLAQGWDDGLAEVAHYRLEQFRYGRLHPGTATLIAVREAMDPQRSVKSTDGGGVPVLKLHWVRSFQTGVYRYDQSSFQLVGRADGLLRRWLITSHEWCGAAAKSWQPGGPLRTSSYFDGHGDIAQPLELGADAVPADSLWWWARAWVAAGSPARALRVLPSQVEARAVATEPLAATIAAAPEGDGRIAVTVTRGGLSDRLVVDAAPPHALRAWRQADGSQLTLEKIERSAYWTQHDPEHRR
jgi:hypothetical protein